MAFYSTATLGKTTPDELYLKDDVVVGRATAMTSRGVWYPITLSGTDGAWPTLAQVSPPSTHYTVSTSTRNQVTCNFPYNVLLNVYVEGSILAQTASTYTYQLGVADYAQSGYPVLFSFSMPNVSHVTPDTFKFEELVSVQRNAQLVLVGRNISAADKGPVQLSCSAFRLSKS